MLIVNPYWLIGGIQCFILFYSFPLLLAFDVWGLGFEFCHGAWMDTAMHDMGSLDRPLAALPRDWANLVWRGVVSPGSAGAELRAVFYFISSFPFLLAFDVGGLGFELCVFVAG